MRLINISVLIAAFWAFSAPVFNSPAPWTAVSCAFAAENQEHYEAPAQPDQPADVSVVLYRVMAVVLIVWIGLAVFLFRLDRRVAAIEKEIGQRG